MKKKLIQNFTGIQIQVSIERFYGNHKSLLFYYKYIGFEEDGKKIIDLFI